MQIGIVDYGASNIFSVLRAISFLGAKAKIVANPEELKSIDKIIPVSYTHLTLPTNACV